MSKPKKQHYVPQVYLRNFSYENKKLYRLFAFNKALNKIISTNVEDIASERNFYTLEKADNKYEWENFYAENLEPFMGKIIKDIIKKCDLRLFQKNAIILNEETKFALSIIIVYQMLRGKHARSYQRKIFDEKAPEVMKDVKKRFLGKINKEIDEQIVNFKYDEEIFKLISRNVVLDSERIINFAKAFFNRSWLFIKIDGNSEFVTSDDPIVIMNKDTLDVTPFNNGIGRNNTIIYYPLSSKLILAMYPNHMLFGAIQNWDRTLTLIDEKKENNFIFTMNSKQLDHCSNYIYSSNRETIVEIKKVQQNTILNK